MPYFSHLPVPLNEFDTHQALFNNLKAGDAGHEPASLPVSNSTHSFWLHPSKEVNPLAKEGSDGPLVSDADLCIIGSGITGISAAYHVSKMSEKPLKVVILEARDFCSGATGRNGGHLTPGLFLDFSGHVKDMGASEALKQYALERHSVTEICSIVKEHGLEETVDFVSGGHIDLMFSELELDSEAAQEDFRLAKEAGADLSEAQWFTADEMEKVHGTKYAAVKIPGHNLWPLKLVTQLFYMAKSTLGSLHLHTNTPVTSITPSTATGDRRWELHTSRGSVLCRSVLHATNGYASHLLPFLSGPSGIVPVRGQIIATRASVPLNELGTSSWSGNEGFEYWFPRPLKHPDTGSTATKPLVILGGGREAEQSFELNETDDSVLGSKASEALRRFLPAVFPNKFQEGEQPEVEWTGIMGFTSLRDPFVGPVINEIGKEIDGQYISAGYTGHGMPRTYACAEAVVSLILHDFEKAPRGTWSPPNWLPNRYLTWNRSEVPVKK